MESDPLTNCTLEPARSIRSTPIALSRDSISPHLTAAGVGRARSRSSVRRCRLRIPYSESDIAVRSSSVAVVMRPSRHFRQVSGSNITSVFAVVTYEGPHSLKWNVVLYLFREPFIVTADRIDEISSTPEPHGEEALSCLTF